MLFGGIRLLRWSPLSTASFYNQRPMWFAHRGALHQAPENTMASYTKALEVAMPAIEMDVVLTKDNRIVCSHNHDLERETDGFGYIGEKTYAQISSLNAGIKWKNKIEPIPLMEDMLNMFSPEIRINIEIKTRKPFDFKTPVKVAKIIQDKGFQGRVIVSSFNPVAIWAVKRVDRSIITGLILENPRMFPFVYFSHPDCVHLAAELVTSRLINFSRKKHMAINVWTVNAGPAAKWLLKKGVDGLMTDRPEIRTYGELI